MPAPTRLLTGTCEIRTGTLTITGMPPVFQGDNSIGVSITLTDGGNPYTIPNDVTASMHLYYMHNQTMTESQSMQTSGDTISGIITDVLTALGGTPLLVIRLVDVNGIIITACAIRVTIIRTLGSTVIATIPPTPDEIIYVGRAPYIGENGHWFQWDNDQKIYVDTAIEARGPVGPPGGVNNVNGKQGDVNLVAEDVGAAPSMHYHDAGAIASGVMPIARGGTGAGDAAQALANLGGMPKSGGAFTGPISFDGHTIGLVWQTANGTIFSLRPYTDGNIFQITVRGPDTGNAEQPTFNITSGGQLDLHRALPVGSGGTGAADAAGARANLGAAELRDNVVIVNNQKGIGTNVVPGQYWQLWNWQDDVDPDRFPVALCPTENGIQNLGLEEWRIKAIYANNYPCGTWNGNPIALNKGGLGRAFANEAALKTYLQGLLGLS